MGYFRYGSNQGSRNSIFSRSCDSVASQELELCMKGKAAAACSAVPRLSGAPPWQSIPQQIKMQVHLCWSNEATQFSCLIWQMHYQPRTCNISKRCSATIPTVCHQKRFYGRVLCAYQETWACSATQLQGRWASISESFGLRPDWDREFAKTAASQKKDNGKTEIRASLDCSYWKELLYCLFLLSNPS